jgi:hypothetical protein
MFRPPMTPLDFEHTKLQEGLFDSIESKCGVSIQKLDAAPKNNICFKPNMVVSNFSTFRR